MITPVLAVFCILVIFSKIGQRYQKCHIVVAMITMILVLIATFRPSESPDYENYLLLYDYEFEYKEVGYLYIIQVSKDIFNNPLYMFFLSAAISIPLKVYAIRRISPFFFLSIIVYISNIYILHDMIQMRCAIASGLLLWALIFYSNNNKVKFIVTSLLAISFHYSAIIIFIIPLLGKRDINRILTLVVLIVSYLLAVSGFGIGYLWSYIPYGEYARLWETYNQKMQSGEMNQINLFNAFFLARFLICVILIYFSEKIKQLGYIYLLGLKMYVLSICMFLLFSDMPILAFRLSELFQVVEVIIFPSMVLMFRNRMLGQVFVISLSTAFLLVNIFYNQLVL